MPPKITEVKWNAENVPLGVSFNENTGTFSGEPEEAGEYTVPVTVETNYGIDTKDVIITVEPPTYGVWSKPRKWNPNGAEPDDDGFYPVNVPEAEKLSDWAYGFRAYTKFGYIYGCGLSGLNVSWGSVYTYSDKPFQLDKYTSSSAVRCITDTYYIDTTKCKAHIIYSYATLTSENKMTITHSLFYEIPLASDPRYCNAYLKEISGISKSSITDLPILGVINTGQGLRWLSGDGMQDCYLTYSVNKNSHTASATLHKKNLGYKAIKILRATPFSFLSETSYLDNNPNNFTHGMIKDIWAYGAAVYVQTTANQLYEYVSSSNTWNLLGTYDIKKAEVPNANYIFFLTNDGKLYHKGNAVSGVTEAHETLTHIFPSQKFIDFTYSYNTLLVLKE